MCVNSNANRVFNWFVNLVAVGGLMTYIGICLTYIRFRQGADYHKIDRETLPFRSGFARAGAWIGLCTIPGEYKHNFLIC
jgi:amino acid transporter